MKYRIKVTARDEPITDTRYMRAADGTGYVLFHDYQIAHAICVMFQLMFEDAMYLEPELHEDDYA